MEKPTIFFSHSSKDRDLILPIKEKIVDITGGVMTVFMSSDGQSIPLGRNWVGKIEEGLKNAQIMFIFVTPNSIKSDWIYFEAGFAYAKGIEVIPVGIGVHIGELKAPLNLLQGFDILSCDSLDNFISVINKRFDLSFKGKFNEVDYCQINNTKSFEKNDFDFSNIIKCGYIESSRIFSVAEIKKDSELFNSKVEKFFAEVKKYLDKNRIKYSFFAGELLVKGIKIIDFGEKEDIQDNRLIKIDHSIMLFIANHNFKESFELLINLLNFVGIQSMTLNLEINKSQYDCWSDLEQISSIVSEIEYLGYSQSSRYFKYKEKICWYVYDGYFYNRNQTALNIRFELKEINISDVIDFVQCLYISGIIYKLES
ncbi:MAG: toll/interleukin-1 receptor domain-containing protein [Lachnospiraceae bacterium]|nr:toll/interleukin-1 receptor domain-containing protein [Lachnospiraceae bacterium]